MSPLPTFLMLCEFMTYIMICETFFEQFKQNFISIVKTCFYIRKKDIKDGIKKKLLITKTTLTVVPWHNNK